MIPLYLTCRRVVGILRVPPSKGGRPSQPLYLSVRGLGQAVVRSSSRPMGYPLTRSVIEHRTEFGEPSPQRIFEYVERLSQDSLRTSMLYGRDGATLNFIKSGKKQVLIREIKTPVFRVANDHDGHKSLVLISVMHQ